MLVCTGVKKIKVGTFTVFKVGYISFSKSHSHLGWQGCFFVIFAAGSQVPQGVQVYPTIYVLLQDEVNRCHLPRKYMNNSLLFPLSNLVLIKDSWSRIDLWTYDIWIFLNSSWTWSWNNSTERETKHNGYLKPPTKNGWWVYPRNPQRTCGNWDPT